jgi:hypothetical protein
VLGIHGIEDIGSIRPASTSAQLRQIVRVEPLAGLMQIDVTTGDAARRSAST